MYDGGLAEFSMKQIDDERCTLKIGNDRVIDFLGRGKDMVVEYKGRKKLIQGDPKEFIQTIVTTLKEKGLL